MAYLKKYYRLDEVVDIFSQYDDSIKTNDDVKHLIYEGELDA